MAAQSILTLANLPVGTLLRLHDTNQQPIEISVTGSTVLTMPPPSGVNDLPAFNALVTQLVVAGGGTVEFLPGTYLAPSPGFRLFHVAGIAAVGAGSTIGGTGTVLKWTGPRTPGSSVASMLACNGCSFQHLAVDSNVSGPENGIVIGGDGGTDALLCFTFDVHCYGNSAADPVATSATAIDVSTTLNVPQAIVLNAATVPYAVGTRLLLCSRAGDGILEGEINASAGVNVTFTPRDVFGAAGVLSDWDVIQAMNGITCAGSELCGISRCFATLCYTAFFMGGVGGFVDSACSTSSPLGPSMRTGSSSNYVQLFGVPEVNVRYSHTVALVADGALNLTTSLSLGDSFTVGPPFVFRNVQGGIIHGIAADSATAGGSLLSVEACQGLSFRSVRVTIPGGSIITNKGSNSDCSIDAVFAQGGMVTFAGGNTAGFVRWYDTATQLYTFGGIQANVMQTRFGITYAEAALGFHNGDNNNVGFNTAFQHMFGPTGAFALTGVAPVSDGWLIHFYYDGAEALTLKHDDAASTFGQRLKCPTGADIVLGAPPAGGFLFFDLMYSVVQSAWLVILPR